MKILQIIIQASRISTSGICSEGIPVVSAFQITQAILDVIPQKAIVDTYRISEYTVSKIKNGRIYTNVLMEFVVKIANR